MARTQKLLLYYFLDCQVHYNYLCRYLSRVDTRILFNKIYYMRLNARRLDGSLSSQIEKKRLKCPNHSKSTISCSTYFMVCVASVLEGFLIVALSHPTISTCAALHVTHIHQFAKEYLTILQYSRQHSTRKL
jgi:hypothetical protein